MYTFDSVWLDKLEEMRAKGIEPYPSGLRVTHASTELHRRYVGVDHPETEALEVSIGGRVMFRNRMGRAIFLRIQDGAPADVDDVDGEGAPVQRGGLIQVYARRDEIGDDAFDLLRRIDIGDILWVQGQMMRTRTGELTVKAAQVRLAGKVMSPFPDRWHSVTDPELRARQRYVDLFMNASTRETFRKRSRILRGVRDYFESHGFLEVETPMMHPIPGGASARPFVTHHNALDTELYLRIAPELYLKRLIVGGFDRVFEINRSFRNEGLSTRHNPEFTMLEFYQAWATWEDMMEHCEQLITRLVHDVHDGNPTVEFGGMTIDFTSPWRRADMSTLITETTGLTRDALEDCAAMEAYWRAHHPVREDETLPTSRGKWWETLFEAHVESTLVHPTFVTGFPAEISPLARRRDDDPTVVDRFELFVATWELANAFSELNDPVDQAERFARQVEARAGGDEEGMHFDQDYIRALSYGMPPTAGQGIGIDRLVMLLTGTTSIREVILFPTLRPERAPQDDTATHDG